MSEKGTTLYPVRLTLIVAVFCLWCIAILGRLGYLQVLQHGQFLRSAQERQQLTRSLPAPRGIIYDSGLNLLATSAPVSRVIAEPRKIKNPAETAQALAPVLDLDPARLLKRLQDPARRSYLVVKQRIGPQEEAEIDALDLEGVYFEEGSMRAYPNMELACHVLGFVNMEGNGGAGIELQYDRELKGRPGLQSHDVDARRVSFRGKVIQPPVQGHSLVTSLDKTIQFIVERELAEGVRSNRAVSGTAIVMEPATGRILALANYPGFNSNLYNEAAPELWRNKAATDFFEPGSTFKVVVAAAALEAGLTRPEELIDCQMGSIIIGRHAFRDHKPYGLLTFRQVLENSSNVGAAKLGLRLGEPALHGFLQQFGFGARTGIDLPGEVAGLVRHPRDWSALSIGAISFGQEIGVTSLQILRAINAVANGGYLVTPTVVDRIIDDKGDLIRVRAAARNRILSPRTAAAVSDAFEGVVLRGTGRRGSVEGYRCAGKTGTAQKIIQGRYSDTKYLSSFIGFAPLPDPQISVLV
ncbi:MAG: penicillin-binding protein 2, partial [Acidobacteriota bacterium]